jgi:hypothetical protein
LADTLILAPFRNKDGSPIRPYDMSTDTMDEFMGVRVDPVDEPVKAELAKLTGSIEPHGKVGAGAAGYVVDGRLNHAFKAVNLLLAKDVAVRRVDKAAEGFRPGDFIVGRGNESLIASVARDTCVDFTALRAEPAGLAAHVVKKLRIAMYQRYNGGNISTKSGRAG